MGWWEELRTWVAQTVELYNDLLHESSGIYQRPNQLFCRHSSDPTCNGFKRQWTTVLKYTCIIQDPNPKTLRKPDPRKPEPKIWSFLSPKIQTGTFSKDPNVLGTSLRSPERWPRLRNIFLSGDWVPLRLATWPEEVKRGRGYPWIQTGYISGFLFFFGIFVWDDWLPFEVVYNKDFMAKVFPRLSTRSCQVSSLRRRPRSRLVALGGATEVTVWSNAFEVGAVDAAWT